MENSKQQIADWLNNKEFVFLDGALGSNLQRVGLRPGESPEIWNMEHPEAIVDLHRRYLDAGSRVIYANTFGASAYKLARTAYRQDEIIPAAIALAKEAVQTTGYEAKVALDIGPIGELLKPHGPLSFDTAYDEFKRQVILGTEAGADLIVFETFTDLYELKAGLLAAYENSPLPVICSMSFEADGRTFHGVDLLSYVTLAESLHAQVLGLNCSAGPDALLPLIQKMASYTNLPLFLKPNAGLPDPITGTYALKPKDFARQMNAVADLGIQILGGCCGTTPEHLKALSMALREKPRPKRQAVEVPLVVSSAVQAVVVGQQALLVGENLNPTGKKQLKTALRNADFNVYQKMAVEQQEAGADILDINCGEPGIDEVYAMSEAVTKVQEVCTLPLQIDSNKPEVLEAGLRLVNGRPIVNSVNAKKESLEQVLPLVKHYGAAFIALPIGEKGIPATAEERLLLFEEIAAAARSLGIPEHCMIADCLMLTVAAEPEGAKESLRTIRLVKERLGVKTILGLSNVSFGLPNRRLLNQVFYAEALQAGLDLAIVNPLHSEMHETRLAHHALMALDPAQRTYLAAMAERSETQPEVSQETVHTGSSDLGTAIRKGLKSEARTLAEKLLSKKAALEIIAEDIMPALDQVGEAYQAQTIFLPQLLQASEASQAALEPVQKVLAQERKEDDEQGIVIVATVAGDVHDIGKNIAKIIMQNYGYRVVDLGKDVPVSAVVEAVLQHEAKLVGLSALMTSTLPAMQETVKAVKAAKKDCRILVAGAVVTESYAAEIGADYYCPDAMGNIAVCREVLE